MKNQSTKPKLEVKQRVSFYISGTTKTSLLEAVETSGLSVSSYVTQLVTKGLRVEKKKEVA